MTSPPDIFFMNNKQQQREKAYAIRNAQTDKEQFSTTICNRIIEQCIYQQAETIMWYLHCRSEVRTLKAVTAELGKSKRIVIPYCTTDLEGKNKLGLWLLNDLSELVPGTWGILEPRKSEWTDPEKQVLAQELDLIIVPGVAFDRTGGRLGNGAGYYDRLLQQVRPDTVLSAICYESQLFEKVIMDGHDVFMDQIITQSSHYTTKANGLERHKK